MIQAWWAVHLSLGGGRLTERLDLGGVEAASIGEEDGALAFWEGVLTLVGRALTLAGQALTLVGRESVVLGLGDLLERASN